MNSSNQQLINPYRRLRSGCYVLHYLSNEPYADTDANPGSNEVPEQAYEGTLRVVHYTNDGTRALPVPEALTPEADSAPTRDQHGLVLCISGDLYATDPANLEQVCREIPIFPRHAYRFYLLATGLRELPEGEFELTLDSYEFLGDAWSDPNPVVARLGWTRPPENSPSADDYLCGPVYDAFGNELGALSLNWVSRYLRRAVLELDRVNEVRLPLDNFSGLDIQVAPENRRTWRGVFRGCGWDVEAKPSDQPAEPASRTWTEQELQLSLPALRDTFDLDTEWRYHLFCVGRLEDGGRGYKFDIRGIDGRGRLFESVVIAARYIFPNDRKDGAWGPLAGRFLEDTPAYFRTSVHEVGHAMKLDHNFENNGFMATTDAIFQELENQLASPPEPTPRGAPDHPKQWLQAVEWEFAEADCQRLRHWPDIVIRPGGGAPHLPLPGIDAFRFVPLRGGESGGWAPSELELDVRPFAEEVPVGAPVRLLLSLRNKGDKELSVPTLRLKSGNIYGVVERKGDARRSFLPLAETLDGLGTEILPRNETTHGSLTLLRGPDGPLFPGPGIYHVTVEVRVYQNRRYHRLTQTTRVTVIPFIDDRQRRIAELLRDRHEVLLSLALGGDGLTEGNQAINLALNDPVLSPHFQIVRLKRLVRGIGRVRGYLGEAMSILRTVGPSAPVLTPSELAGLVRILRQDQDEDGGRDSETDGPVPINRYLQSDLRLVAIRIVLGQIGTDTLRALEELFLHRARQGQEAGPPQQGPPAPKLTPAKARAILESLLQTSAGLTPTDSREICDLLFARGSSVWERIDEVLQDPTKDYREEIRKALATVGFSVPELRALLQRLRGVMEQHPEVLSENDLRLAKQKVIDTFRVTSRGRSDLRGRFLVDLRTNLDEAFRTPPESTASTAPDPA